MSVLLQLQKGTKSFGSRDLFSNASFAVNEGEHIGVIGPNGAGKSTLFKILMGQEDLQQGQVIASRSCKIGYLEQEEVFSEDTVVEDYVMSKTHLPLWQVKEWGRGLGLTDEMMIKTVHSLSGGYRMRCKLLGLLAQEPNLLLLDEPTNYLDLESLLALEKFLVDYKQSFMLISHDREFLRRVTDHILEIEAGDFTKFSGHIDDYFEQKLMLQKQLKKRALSQQAKRKEILDFATRFGAKATKARQVQSRLKQLKRMEEVTVKSLPTRARIHIPEPERLGKQLLNITNLDIGYPEKKVLYNVDLQIHREEHLGVVGYNGAGKSTLLKTLALKIPCLKGEVEWAYKTTLSYYAQHVAEALLDKDTVLSSLSYAAHSDINLQNIKNMAGSLLFSDDDMNKKISVLSGGEKARVALGQVLLQKSSCLILDEPTNHLDFDTVEALTQALSSYKGTLLVVSHDRSFISRVANKVIEIDSGLVKLYPGTYQDYLWSLEKGMMSKTERIQLKQDEIKEAPKKKQAKKQIHERSKKAKQLEKQINQLEKEIETLTRELSKSNKGIEEKGQKLFDLQQQLEKVEHEWLHLNQ